MAISITNIISVPRYEAIFLPTLSAFSEKEDIVQESDLSSLTPY